MQVRTKLTEHHFRVDDAVSYGVEGAVILQNLRYWIDRNLANRKNFHEGYCWTYNSARAFSEILPYFNAKKIQRLLVFLEEEKAVMSCCLNKKAYDKTKWYTIPEFGKVEDRSVQPLDNIVQALPINVQPIPDNNTYIKTDVSDESVEYLISLSDDEVKYLTRIYRATPGEIRTKGEALYNWSLAKGKKQRMYRPFLKMALERDFGKRERHITSNPATL